MKGNSELTIINIMGTTSGYMDKILSFTGWSTASCPAALSLNRDSNMTRIILLPLLATRPEALKEDGYLERKTLWSLLSSGELAMTQEFLLLV